MDGRKEGWKNGRNGEPPKSVESVCRHQAQSITLVAKQKIKTKSV